MVPALTDVNSFLRARVEAVVVEMRRDVDGFPDPPNPRHPLENYFNAIQSIASNIRTPNHAGSLDDLLNNARTEWARW